jgi:hypothetical protein
MIRNGRPIDQNFRSFHLLYYRCKREDIEGNRLLAPKIKSFDISVNWSKYSKPWDVIFGEPAAGIALFVVCDVSCDLPRELSSEQREAKKIHSYRPTHEPYDDNYSHSEIAVFKDDKRITKSSGVGEIAKKEFRQIISDKCLIVRWPLA